MSDRFPHTFTPELRVPAWQRFRAEGRSLRESLLNSVSYVRKWAYKKATAPPEELWHFACQRELFRYLLNRPPVPGSVRTALVGDVMWLRDGWDAFLDPRVRDYLNSHDVVLGNLESVISKRFKVPSLLPDYFTYNSHPNLVKAFRRPDGRNTFTALSLSNNHALDRGEVGARDTQDLLGELNIPHSGVSFHPDQRPYAVFEANGVKFGFYAAAWGINSFVPPDPKVRMNALPLGVFESGARIDLPEIRRVLADMAADGCDFRVVALHWGYEFEYYPCPGVMRVGHEVVRAGADVVLGTHPHVQQPCETLFVNGYEDHLPEQYRALAADGASTIQADGPPRKALIAYSMGNFASTMFTFACKVGWILSLQVFRDPTSGQVDWKPDASAFVVNVPRMPRSRERRLLMLEDYQLLGEEHGGLPRFERDHITFLQQHILGDAASH